jgi:hypothetical protein
MTPEQYAIVQEASKELERVFSSIEPELAIPFFAGWLIGLMQNHGATKKDVSRWLYKAIDEAFKTPRQGVRQ